MKQTIEKHPQKTSELVNIQREQLYLELLEFAEIAPGSLENVHLLFDDMEASEIWDVIGFSKLFQEILDCKNEDEKALKTLEILADKDVLRSLKFILYAAKSKDVPEIKHFESVLKTMQKFVTTIEITKTDLEFPALSKINFPPPLSGKSQDIPQVDESALQRHFVETHKTEILELATNLYAERAIVCLPLFIEKLNKVPSRFDLRYEGVLKYSIATPPGVLNKKDTEQESDDVSASTAKDLHPFQRVSEDGYQFQWDEFFLALKTFSHLDEGQKRETFQGIILLLFREIECAYSFEEYSKEKEFSRVWSEFAKWIEKDGTIGHDSEFRKLLEWFWKKEMNAKTKKRRNSNSASKLPHSLRVLFEKWKKEEHEQAQEESRKEVVSERLVTDTKDTTEKIISPEKPSVPNFSNRGRNKIYLNNTPENNTLWISINGDIFPLDITSFSKSADGGVDINFSDFIQTIESHFHGTNLNVKLSFGEDKSSRTKGVPLRLSREIKEELDTDEKDPQDTSEEESVPIPSLQNDLLPQKILEASQKNIEAGLWYLLSEDPKLATITRVGESLNITFSQNSIDELEIDGVPFILVSGENFKITFLHEEETVSLEILNKDLKEEIQKIVNDFKKKEEESAQEEVRKSEEKEKQQQKEELIKNNRERLKVFKEWFLNFQESPIYDQIRNDDIAFRGKFDYCNSKQRNPYDKVLRLKAPNFGNSILPEVNEQLKDASINVTQVKNSESIGKMAFRFEFQNDAENPCIILVKFLREAPFVEIEFQSEKVPSEIQEKVEGISKNITHFIAKKCTEGLPSAKNEKKEVKEFNRLRTSKSCNLEKGAYKRLLNNEGRIVSLRNKNGYVAVVSNGQSLQSAKEKEILVRNSLFKFAGEGDDGKGESRWNFNPEKYTKLREVLEVVRNRKHLIRRIMRTACEELNVSPGENTAEAIHHPKQKKITEQVLGQIGESWESLSDTKLSPSDILDREDDLLKKNWIDNLVDAWERAEIPLIEVEHAITITMDDLEVKACNGKWDKELSKDQTS